MVGSHPETFVLEIGAGTGAITAALLRDCVPLDRLVAIERSQPMVNLLRQRFDGLRVIEGDACHLTQTLRGFEDIPLSRITHVVSSLPLRSLPDEHVEAITGQFGRILAHGARLIQYTYNLRNGSGTVFAPFQRQDSSVVWFNIPPARVEVFTAAPAHQTRRPRPAGASPRPASPAPFSLGAATKPVNASPRH